MENIFELIILPTAIIYGALLALVLLIYVWDWVMESGVWVIILIAGMMLYDYMH